MKFVYEETEIFEEPGVSFGHGSSSETSKVVSLKRNGQRGNHHSKFQIITAKSKLEGLKCSARKSTNNPTPSAPGTTLKPMHSPSRRQNTVK